MKINLNILIYILIIFIISSKTLQSKNFGDLTKQKPIEMNVQLNGKIGEMHFFSPNILIFKTGKLYKLKIINTSKVITLVSIKKDESKKSKLDPKSFIKKVLTR